MDSPIDLSDAWAAVVHPVAVEGGEFILRTDVHAAVVESSRAAILTLAMLYPDGGRLENPLGWPVSKTLGVGYRYLPAADEGKSNFVLELVLPSGASAIEVRFRAWKPAGQIVVERVRLQHLRAPLRPPPPSPLAAPKPSPPAPGPALIDELVDESLVIRGGPLVSPVQYSIEPGFGYVLEVDTTAEGEPDRAFVLQPHFVRSDGRPAEAAGKGFATSPRFGRFAYLNAGVTELRFTAPNDAAGLTFTLHPWGARQGTIKLGRELRLVSVSEQAIEMQIRDELEAVFAAADPNGVFICIYTGTKRIGEGNRANRSMIFARDAARLGFSTIYTYSPSEGETDYARTNDRLLQVPLPTFSRISGLIAQRAPGRTRVLLGSMPDAELCRNIGLYLHHGWTYVYECRDEWEEFAAVGSGGWYDEAFERYATQQAAKVFCVSPSLQAKMRRFTTKPEKVLVSPNATTDEFLAGSAPIRQRSMRRHAKAPSATPRIGYFGHLTEQWFDWGALLNAAASQPGAVFEIIGFDMPDIPLPANMHYLGSKRHDEIMDLAQHWDVGLIPFKPGRLSRAVDPIKVYEYLALGIKVVSTPMGSLDSFPLTFCYEEFGLPEALAKAIAHRPSRNEWRAVDRILDRASWRHRLTDLLQACGVDLSRQLATHDA